METRISVGGGASLEELHVVERMLSTLLEANKGSQSIKRMAAEGTTTHTGKYECR